MTSSSLELPFQWDDGNYLAPFVRTKDSTLQNVQTILFGGERASAVDNEDSSSTTATNNHLQLRDGDVFVDAGCGDGRVPIFVAASAISSEMKNVKILGIDLDKELVDQCKTEAKKMLTTAAAAAAAADNNSVKIEFLCEDLRNVVLLLQRADVMFIYLLPGLELSDLILKVTEHWRRKDGGGEKNASDEEAEKKEKDPQVPEQQQLLLRLILSNTWPIECLKDFEVAHVGEIYVYGGGSAYSRE